VWNRRVGAEAIRKGKIAKPTQFGKLVTIQESEHQIITAYEAHATRPPDVTLWWTASLDRHIAMFGPRAGYCHPPIVALPPPRTKTRR
jgi:hypothetical protein